MQQMNGIPVHITFSSDIQDQDEKAHFSFETNGLYYIKDHKSFLLFEEKIEEQGPVKTTVRFGGDEAWIRRSGSVNMRIPFRLHNKTKGIHETPHIKLEVTATTDDISHEWDEQNRTGFFRLTYRLSMRGEEVGTYLLHIAFKEE
ncbi:DUF1934 domain-containing protein [Bacillus suaedaesalsae]|uniref:DUF1934 family protein n=1 Tax=Bacillus suaedaesalsae TaxID=2810349 RepID=A0ABS2DE95_9BACI|nr:DUF1934 domain-containing protein [Bacillus suaedaesalsae]MBM6616791.1 DUF1934 family protein [Bacillus suaedaesalsae]